MDDEQRPPMCQGSGPEEGRRGSGQRGRKLWERWRGECLMIGFPWLPWLCLNATLSAHSAAKDEATISHPLLPCQPDPKRRLRSFGQTASCAAGTKGRWHKSAVAARAEQGDGRQNEDMAKSDTTDLRADTPMVYKVGNCSGVPVLHDLTTFDVFVLVRFYDVFHHLSSTGSTDTTTELPRQGYHNSALTAM